LIGTTSDHDVALFANGTGCLTLNGASSVKRIGVLGATPVAQQTVTGSRGGNAALASFLTALATFGFIVDSTTA
jgi:hypothetical protein